MSQIQQKLQDIKQTLNQYYRQNPSRFTLVLSLILISLLAVLQLMASPARESKLESSTEIAWEQALLEHMPEGTTLVPLNLVNQDSIIQMVSEVGYVDLFAVEAESKRRQKVAQNLKVVKTEGPEGSLIMAIVPETDEKLIHQLQQDLFAIIKSPRRSKAPTRQTKNKTRTMIIRGEEL